TEHGQTFARDRNLAGLIAEDDRDRATPVTLARHVPVAEAITDAAGAVAVFLEPGDDLRDPVGRFGLVEWARVHHQALALVRCFDGVALRLDHDADRQASLFRELEVAL